MKFSIRSSLRSAPLGFPLVFPLLFPVFAAILFSAVLSWGASPKLVVIAHRGASGYLPEHTLAGAALAHAMNADFIEADLVLTKDAQLIVLHDIYLDTTTNVAEVFPTRKRKDGRYYAIDFTLAEVKQLQAVERFNPKTGKAIFADRYPSGATGFTVPSFNEFVTLVKSLNKSRDRDAGLYPEIKDPLFHEKEGQDITKLAIEAIRKQGYEETGRIYIQCFSPTSLKRLKSEFKTKIPLVQLIGENSWGKDSLDFGKMRTEKGLKEIATYANGIGPTLRQVQLNKSLLKWAHAEKLFVHAYTHRADQRPAGLSNDDNIKAIRSLGIDGIFTDFSDQF